MTRLLLIGATGSIGRSALDVVRALAPEIRLLGVFARADVAGLAAIAREFDVSVAGLSDEAALPALRAALPGVRTGVGEEFLKEAIAGEGVDVVLSAAAGAAGLPASLHALRCGRRLALANKESMVMAGPLLLREAERAGAQILPVDSEHSAIFQALSAGRPEEVRRLILTASGGPFRTWSRARIAKATPEDALRHPTWSMGRKISVDSATLMNKALELVEARWLFGVEPGALDVVIHPQSIVHSMVEFRDGSIVAQMGPPDMRLPIQFALTWPRRLPSSLPGFRVADFAALTFEAPDRERFPALDAADRALELSGTAGAVLNAANEVAVERFLAGEIPFPAIADLVRAVLERASIEPDPDLDRILAADSAAREDARLCRT